MERFLSGGRGVSIFRLPRRRSEGRSASAHAFGSAADCGLTSLLWDGPPGTIGALPRVSSEMVRALLAAGVSVVERRGQRPSLYGCDRGRSRRTAVDVHLRFVPARYLGQSRFLPGTRHVGYTFCESTALDGRDLANLARLDAVLVPSTFCRDVVVRELERNGSTVPVKVVPHGVETPGAYHPPSVDGPTVFLAIAAAGKRKGMDVLARAFDAAFDRHADVELRVVGSASIPGANPKVARCGVVSDADLDQEIEGCHCLVLPTRGEGFCLPVLEAAAHGRTSIVTAWSGHLDFARTGEHVYLLNVERFVPRDDGGVGAGLWAEPSLDHLVELLRHVASHREEAIAKGLRFREDVSDRWTWSAAARACIEALDLTTRTVAERES